MPIYKLALLHGDGIGPEVIQEAVKVLKVVGAAYTFEFTTTAGLIGGIAIDETGTPLPESTIELCRQSDAVLLGAVGGPKWDTTDPDKPRPEQGLLGIRKELELFANLRPVKIYEPLKDASSLKPEIITGIDIMVVRELTGGIYFGERARRGNRAFDTCDYSKEEIERLLKAAFELAQKRRGVLHSVDKANVLESSRLWREVAIEMSGDYPEVELHHMLVDNCAMQLVRDPKQFDVIATGNMFGDILSDEASMLSGSLGMLASASLGATGLALYEPSHGSAPDIAGQGIANPIATIASTALMLKYSFNLDDAAAAIDGAIDTVLSQGWRTQDIMQAGGKLIGTQEMGDKIAASVTANMAQF